MSQATMIGPGTGDHGSIGGVVTTAIEAVALIVELVESPGAPEEGKAVAGPAVAGPAVAEEDGSSNMDSYWSGAPEFPGSEVSEEWVTVDDGVRLRVITWRPTESINRPVVVFVAGWGSVFEGWRPLISKWSAERTIVYIETREKGSSEISKKISKSDFSVEKLSSDLAEVLRFYELDSTDIDWFSSSLGSTILIDAFSHGRLSGRSSILLAPNSEFKFPIWARAMIIMPLPRFMYSMIVRLAVWAVERKVKEEGQRVRYRRALLSQDLQKMHLSARSLIRYSLPENLEGISFPCAVMTAYSDKLHGMDKAMGIVDRIPDCKFIEVPSNQYAHEADVISDINDFQSLE